MEDLKIEKANALQDAQDEVEAKGEEDFGPKQYQRFENKWRREMQKRNVFGDIIEEYNAIKGGPQKSPAEQELERLKAQRDGVQ
jgi:hypothetical protein